MTHSLVTRGKCVLRFRLSDFFLLTVLRIIITLLLRYTFCLTYVLMIKCNGSEKYLNTCRLGVLKSDSFKHSEISLKLKTKNPVIPRRNRE